MKKHLFLASTLLAATPVVVLVSGCGGGNGGGILNPTARTYTSNFALSSSQTAQLSLRVAGDIASGTLVVRGATSDAARATRSISPSIPVDTYALNGTASGSTFSVSGNFGGTIGTFLIAGGLPINGNSSIFTLTVNGQSASGTFISTTPTTISTPTATRTKAPSSTATPIATAPSGNEGTMLTVQAAGGANFGATAFSTSNIQVEGNRLANNRFSIVATDTGNRRLDFSVVGVPYKGGTFQVGTLFDLSSIAFQLQLPNGTATWAASATMPGAQLGSLSVGSINGDRVVFNVRNVVLSRTFDGNNSATGTLTLNGTITANVP